MKIILTTAIKRSYIIINKRNNINNKNHNINHNHTRNHNIKTIITSDNKNNQNN